MTNTQERKEQIIKLAEAQMREHASQYTFQNKTAVLYASQVEGDGRYIVGLLQTEPETKRIFPYCTATLTSDDNPSSVIAIGLSLLEIPDCSFEFWRYINEFKSSKDIRIVPVISRLEYVLETCMKKQSRINAYERGVSYLNKQVSGGKIK